MPSEPRTQEAFHARGRCRQPKDAASCPSPFVDALANASPPGATEVFRRRPHASSTSASRGHVRETLALDSRRAPRSRATRKRAPRRTILSLSRLPLPGGNRQQRRAVTAPARGRHRPTADPKRSTRFERRAPAFQRLRAFRHLLDFRRGPGPTLSTEGVKPFLDGSTREGSSARSEQARSAHGAPTHVRSLR